MSYTPEPWAYKFKGTDKEKNLLNFSLEERAGEERKVLVACGCCDGITCSREDAERIVACVNACAGIDDPEKRIPGLINDAMLTRSRAGLL